VEQGALHWAQAAAQAQAGWAIRLHLQREERLRDLAMFDLAIDSKLRGCDLVRLKIGEVVVNATARHRATIIQKKTEKPVQFELTEQTRDSLLAGRVPGGGVGGAARNGAATAVILGRVGLSRPTTPALEDHDDR
jgi:integrase